jgi:hypothetical protein
MQLLQMGRSSPHLILRFRHVKQPVLVLLRSLGAGWDGGGGVGGRSHRPGGGGSQDASLAVGVRLGAGPLEAMVICGAGVLQGGPRGLAMEKRRETENDSRRRHARRWIPFL